MFRMSVGEESSNLALILGWGNRLRSRRSGSAPADNPLLVAAELGRAALILLHLRGRFVVSTARKRTMRESEPKTGKRSQHAPVVECPVTEVLPVAFRRGIRHYASKDKIVADAVYVRLESSGIRCWIAPAGYRAGTSYGEAIIEAIHGAKVMVLVFPRMPMLPATFRKKWNAVSKGVAILPFASG